MNEISSTPYRLTVPAEMPVPPQRGNAGRPLVDKSVLDRLREDLDNDTGLVTAFIADYALYLPRRIQRLRAALVTGNFDDAVDAVLSLKSSSLMVGATQLAGLAVDLESRIHVNARPDPAVTLLRAADIFLGPISDCGRHTLNWLMSYSLTEPPRADSRGWAAG
ncbi:Hpt domain-containing protein [Pseudarthrobacter sp. fls2-241-R2A-127]|uniref:Hpt domain-containing protein n=1 Tax=Pseudarthrobacter sp. fls2-241-R2A-127 TaxID=3040303 RepID=UPI002553C424|nr:Hpt domain-containing protein [Pseudarthrobacter sp. fls2-241-R2A-127]